MYVLLARQLVEPSHPLVQVPGLLSGHGPQVEVQRGGLLVVAVAVPGGNDGLAVSERHVQGVGLPLVGVDHSAERLGQRVLQRLRAHRRVPVRELVEDEVEQKLRVGCPGDVLEEIIAQRRQQPAADLAEAGHVAVVHEHVAAFAERVAVVLVHGGAGAGGAHVSEEQRGGDGLGQRVQVAVVAGRRHRGVHRRPVVRVQAVLVHHAALLRRVPPDAAPVHVHRVVALLVVLAPRGVPGALGHGREPMRGAEDELGDAHLFAVVEYPATHREGRRRRRRRVTAATVATCACYTNLFKPLQALLLPSQGS
mmetsp:Transcript_15510/g.37557  ORF Transcript_15510/g.37557 Transcript_15510/m.37557 type:complete len:309 (-) Transcript_15510:142-1068(-)